MINSPDGKSFTMAQVQEVMKRKTYMTVGKGKNAVEVDVKIVDWTWAFGHNRFLVTPVTGAGKVWKNARDIRFRDSP